MCVCLRPHAPAAAGFLRTRPGPDREGAAGGNLGLRDILAALQWVRRNVAAFGGDPNRVTVLGHDTGAALVNLLLISSAAKGKIIRLCSTNTTRTSA
jgi:neuroligin